MKTLAQMIQEASNNLPAYLSKPTVGPLIGNPLGLLVLQHQRDMELTPCPLI